MARKRSRWQLRELAEQAQMTGMETFLRFAARNNRGWYRYAVDGDLLIAVEVVLDR